MAKKIRKGTSKSKRKSTTKKRRKNTKYSPTEIFMATLGAAILIMMVVIVILTIFGD